MFLLSSFCFSSSFTSSLVFIIIAISGQSHFGQSFAVRRLTLPRLRTLRAMVHIEEITDEVTLPVRRVNRWNRKSTASEPMTSPNSSEKPSVPLKRTQQPYTLVKSFAPEPCTALPSSGQSKPAPQIIPAATEQKTETYKDIIFMQQRQQQLHGIIRLHSVLGPGGALMTGELYQTKFGNLTKNTPFGINVYKGMASEFENKYRMQQNKAWQLDHCKRYLRRHIQIARALQQEQCLAGVQPCDRLLRNAVPCDVFR